LFGQIRASGREHPVVHIAILGVLAMLADEALASGLRDRVALMRRQAELVLAEAERSSTLAFDRERVRRAAAPLMEEAAAVEP
jgi:uncharacterized membrane protein